MTVGELIAKLQRFPPEATVLVYDWSEDHEPPFPLPDLDDAGRDTVRYYPQWTEVVLADYSALPWWHRHWEKAQPMECEVEEETGP